MKRLALSCYCLFALSVITLSVQAASPPGCVVTFGSVATPPRITNAVAVSVKSSGGHALALLSNGTVTGWGNNSSGQATPPSSATNVVGIAAGGLHSVSVRADGTLVCWGSQATPPGLSNVVAVSAGFSHSLALLADGTVRGWGTVTGLAGLTNVVAIASGIDNNLALKQDGTVVAWGGVNQYGQNNVPANLSDVVAIAAGRSHSLALKSNGTVVNWGNVGVGALPQELPTVTSIAAGNTSLAILSNYRMVRWAYNSTNYLAIPLQQTNFSAIAAGDDAHVAITLQPVIVTNITGFTANAGQNRTLSISAISSTPMSYQWRYSGADIAAATNSLLSLTNLQSPAAGNYDVLVSNAGGSITSSVAAVIVNPAPPTILTNPVSQIALAGSTVIFNVSASGSLPLSFQWWFNGGRVVGATNASLTISNIWDFHAGRYQVGVTNAYGSNFSASATLTINNPPTISNSTTTLVIPAGTNLVLHGFATGNQPLGYQWQFQGTNIPAATNLALALTDVQSGMAGAYSLVASNAFGQLTSQLYSIVVVDSPPIIYQQPASKNCSISNIATLRVIAAGSTPLAYQWYHNAAPVSGATSPHLQIQNFQPAEAGAYFVSISNAFGLTNSTQALLTVGDPYPGQTDLPSLGFNQLTTNSFQSPVGLTSARDGSGRLFIVEQGGRILIVQSNVFFITPFLEISNRVLTGLERGLLGLAFPPGFASNGHFYVDYTRAADGATVISRFSISPTNANVADASSEQILMILPQPYPNHNGGQLAFGPDGYLYIGMGDGGYPFDTLMGDPLNNAQNPASLLGKILRIDVESGASPYAVPPSNPFVGNTNYAPEIWALGLRNPWRFSFDRVTRDLFIGDVGQSSFEEIDFQPGGSSGGQNYGWKYREGPAVYYDITKDPAGFTSPVAWYSRTVGGCVTGGFVYRGPHEQRMDGIYFFGDFLSGRIWALTHLNTNWATSALLRTPYWISTFGEDEQGRLFLADYNTGNVWQIADTRNALPPSLAPAKGPFTNAQNIVVTCPTPGATIRYTTDGRDPNDFDPGVTSGSAVFVDESVTLKVRAFRDDLSPSAVVSTNLSFQVAAPVFSPPVHWFDPTPVTNGTLVTIWSDTPGATIHFTLDGQDADQWSPVYEGAFAVEPIKPVRARAFKQGYSSSPMVSGTFTWMKAPIPQIDPSFGHVVNGATATLFCELPSAELRYTTNGTDPTPSSFLYAEPFPIAPDMNVRARAWVPNYAPSDIMNVTFPPALKIESLSFSGEHPQISWIAAANVWYLIQSSEDLKTWTDLEYTSWFGGYPITFTDSRTLWNGAQRFYRVVTVPSGPP